MIKKLWHFFDTLEDAIRATLSKHPIIYAFVGGTAIVLFWRGVWLVADTIPLLTGPISIIISTGILLAVGLFVSFFIGDSIILSGFKKEKRLDEKMALGVKTEMDMLERVHARLKAIEKELRALKKELRPTTPPTSDERND